MFIHALIKPNTYIDSMMLMALSTKVNDLPLVEKAMIGMGTAMNKQVIGDVGLMTEEIENADKNDLIIVFALKDANDADTVLTQIEELRTAQSQGTSTTKNYNSLNKAISSEPESNLVLFSIPGEYVYQEALTALNHNKHVMIFSDNVPLQDEISLKKLAQEKSLLVMGPDCGTAIINQIGLCFANEVSKGNIGVVAASGTGSQEVSVQIDALNAGISQLIGVGGRDLSEDVGGIMMLQGIKMLHADPKTQIITLISKPPAKSIQDKIIQYVQTLQKPFVVCFIGADMQGQEGNITFARSTTEAAQIAVALSTQTPYVPIKTDATELLQSAKSLQSSQKYIRGLFAGGTVCDEVFYALKENNTVTSNVAGPVESRNQFGEKLTGNALIDFGDDAYTQGKPHPMIDPSFRSAAIVEQAKDPSVAAILLDIELGFGAHDDPVGAMEVSIQEAQKIAKADGRNIIFIAYILGTHKDFQNKTTQLQKLESLNVINANSVADLGALARQLLASI
ncbi:acyl-CoA synthetase FdrA [Wohlfahrtiimonas larvae]|uniref:Acyl-CoA synthetase FdrA n=1 Tax=Wohlfahrtiimonas larvae TaxID=1157986 RepID=A0ABP9MUX3_9GAMM|nr:acyl-CoA synthetase FdrA [Wohlfahrtiimonas larvae]